MTRWGKGEAVIEGALRAGDLQKVEGSAAAGGAHLEAARVRLRSAERVLDEAEHSHLRMTRHGWPVLDCSPGRDCGQRPRVGTRSSRTR